jgi:metal-responsive CopG/Arc/MetJ family transcriptional regulator
MAKKAKLSKEAAAKADEIIAHHGYSSLDELVENLINNEFAKINSDEDNKDEQAEALSGLGYIS